MTHHFQCRLAWVGKAQGAIRRYEHYSRDYEISIDGKPVLGGSAAPPFHGDGARHNPEDLLVASLSGCHFLSYAALCARGRIVVVDYEDAARGTMSFDRDRGVMHFTEVVLRPRVTIADAADAERARALHATAHHECFIANSVNFPVRCEPEILVAAGAD